ncbi:MAG: hypothetical protein JSV91_06360 [Phycisphaerales bacterium]|nr:MAG: hypothetical protein JSV91_06360 [Phycisphaerales bacterium]
MTTHRLSAIGSETHQRQWRRRIRFKRPAACFTFVCLTICAVTALGACSSEPDAGRSLTITPSQEIIRLRATYADLIQTGNTGSKYPEYVRQMETLLEEWNPVGASTEDVVFLLGRPSVRYDDRIVYFFEGGFSGVLWVFQLEDDRVTSVERGSIN